MNVVATSIVLVVLVGVARRWPRAWPAVAGLLLAGLVMLGSFVYPLLVEPLFNNFKSLPDGELRTQILELADEEHVHVDDVLVADASRRTTTLNAYVSGFGCSRRVVVYDNLVDDVSERQVLSVVAHELGHAKHDDVLTGSLLGAAGALLRGRLAGVLLVPGVAEPRQVPRILALVAVATLLASPVQNGISRRIETRADVDAPCGPRRTRRRSSSSRRTWPRPRWPTPRRTGSRSSGSAATRPRSSGSRWPSGSPNELGGSECSTPGPTGTGGDDGVCGSAAGACGVVREDRLAAVLEHPGRATAEREHRDGDHGGDARDEEAVLDGATRRDSRRPSLQRRLEPWLRAEARSQSSIAFMAISRIRAVISRRLAPVARWRRPASRCR